MADRSQAIRCASVELAEAMRWFEHEVRLWRALGGDRHEDGAESVCFRATSMDLDGFLQRVRTAQTLIHHAGNDHDE